jgi:phosphate transport system substrate-binding protein
MNARSLVLALGSMLLAGSAFSQAQVRVDGSSTVFPITEAVAEEFAKVRKDVRVTVGISGTGGGFKRFAAGELDVADASRPIKQKEIDACLAGGVAFIELPVAYDGLSIVVNPKNTWVDHLTVAELKRIWEPGSQVTKWSDVRAGWPDRAIKLYGPGADSGTFDYFTEAIVGTARASRSDYQASEDDNTLVMGVAGDQDGLGYFGFAYFEENAERLELVPVDGGSGPVLPSIETIKTGTYAPLSRPLFIYVRKSARPEVKEFVQFYLDNAPELAGEVGYVPLSPGISKSVAARFAAQRTGSEYAGAKATAELPLAQRYAAAD